MEKLQVYKCGICGNMVELIHIGGGTLVCCGQPMNLLKENTTEAATEKHIPVVEKIGEGLFKVSVGSVQHPMEEKHHIEWIEAIAGERAYRAFLKPGLAPTATFKIDADKISAREYCNLHGLWKS
jgi:superoxide reductase